jgi:hypothetical protein
MCCNGRFCLDYCNGRGKIIQFVHVLASMLLKLRSSAINVKHILISGKRFYSILIVILSQHII